MSHKTRRNVKSLVSAAGLELVDLRTTGGGHLRAVVRSNDGREHAQIFPMTGSDWRGNKNQMADLKRFARGSTTNKGHTT